MNIGFVFCSHYIQPDIALNTIENALLRCSSFTSSDHAYVVVVCNNPSYSLQSYSHKCKASNISHTYVQGSNSLLDISAYHEGLDLLTHTFTRFDFFLFSNDSTFARYSFSTLLSLIIRRIKKPILMSSKLPIIVGHKGIYNDVIHANPLSNLTFFLPTDFFALNKFSISLAVELYSNLIHIECELSSSAAPFEHFLQYLFDHQQGVWEPAVHHNITMDLLKKKRASVIYEHYLSGLIANNSGIIHIVDCPWFRSFSLLVLSYLGKLKLFVRNSFPYLNL